MRALALALIVAMPVAAADVDRVIDAIRKDWKSDHAMKVLNRVYSTDRFFTFPKFEATARFLSEEMRRARLDRVEVVNAPADGETQIGFWTMPLAWDASAAKLELLDPSVPPDARLLADYRKVPSFVRHVERVNGAGGCASRTRRRQSGGSETRQCAGSER